jgi:hypothetical protein
MVRPGGCLYQPRVGPLNWTFARPSNANAEGADWPEVARIVLHLDPEREPARARRAFDSHLSRAKWMTERGYRHLLRGGASAYGDL